MFITWRLVLLRDQEGLSSLQLNSDGQMATGLSHVSELVMSGSHSSDADLMELKSELLAAEEVLNTEYSFDLAEPHYDRCLEIIGRQAISRSDIVALIGSLFSSKSISDEPVAVLVHKLRWPEFRVWVEKELHKLDRPRVDGRPLEKILAAYEDDWGNRVFYKMFS